MNPPPAQWVDVAGSATSLTIDRPSALLINFSGSVFTRLEANTASNVLLTVNIDGVDRTDLFTMDHYASSNQTGVPALASAPAGFSVVVPANAGPHAVKVRVLLSGNWGVTAPAIGIGANGRPSTLSVLAFDRPAG